jgi:ryanodine receptor 2
MEILTHGLVKVGWTSVTCSASDEIGSNSKSFAFDGHNSRKLNLNCEAFGKKWSAGDIIGVMIDLHDHTISYSLNGELLLDSIGSETAFNDINAADAYVPAFTLGMGQRVRLNFGQDVNSLKFFTNYGLQEGYEPFCVNMTRALTLWYSKDIPVYATIDPSDDKFEIIRTNPR